MSAKAADFSLILKLLAGIVIGSLVGTYLGGNTESPLHHLMDVVVSLRYIFGQIIFFLVPLVIVGFITPAIVRLGQNASKILFTAVTLAAGYKGGEVVPSFFIGATFGCVAAPLFGLPAGFGAALGMVAVFCGATNCLFSSLALSVEVFGAEGLLYFAVVCGICHALTGYTGLYSHQGFMTEKLESEYHAANRRST